jgi:flagellar hook-length control protein FliK
MTSIPPTHVPDLALIAAAPGAAAAGTEGDAIAVDRFALLLGLATAAQRATGVPLALATDEAAEPRGDAEASAESSPPADTEAAATVAIDQVLIAAGLLAPPVTPPLHPAVAAAAAAAAEAMPAGHAPSAGAPIAAATTASAAPTALPAPWTHVPGEASTGASVAAPEPDLLAAQDPPLSAPSSLPTRDTRAAPAAAIAEPPSHAVAHVHHAAPTPAPVAAPPVVVAVATPAFEAGWHEETASKVAAVVLRGHERAELRMSPAELGPVDVRIDVRGSEATVAIVAVQPATRDALEQALPFLRDLLAQQGLSLGEATVRDGRAEDPRGNPPGHGSTGRDDAPRSEAAAPPPRRTTRLVDTFA